MPYIVRRTGGHDFPTPPPVAVQTPDQAVLAHLSLRIARTQECLVRSLGAIAVAETMLDDASAVFAHTWRPASTTDRSG
jgi:hypothetical protein